MSKKKNTYHRLLNIVWSNEWKMVLESSAADNWSLNYDLYSQRPVECSCNEYLKIVDQLSFLIKIASVTYPMPPSLAQTTSHQQYVLLVAH